MKMVRNLRGAFFLLTIVSFVLVFMAACSKDNTYSNPSSQHNYTISGNASGTNEVPPVAGNGSATISGTYDPNTRQLNYTTNWSGLSGSPTTGGFYYGASGATGAAIGSTWAFDSTAIATSAVKGTMTLTPDQAKQLTSGTWYYSIGTATNPAGEVRGQITATQQ